MDVKLIFLKFKKVIKQPSLIMLFILNKLSCFFPDKQFLKLKYLLTTGSKLNLEYPKTFSEKLQWLKLYGHRPEYTMMVDKYAVKDYVSKVIGEKYIIPTLGVWNSFEEINFDSLPTRFVLKCTHDSGGLVICKDKQTFDIKKAQDKIEKSLKRNYFYVGREYPYKNVSPRIIAEEYMEDSSYPKKNDDLTDYKFFCFNGYPVYCQVIRGRNTNETIDFYDMKWNHMPFVGLNPFVGNGLDSVKKPDCLEEMCEICKRLALNIPFVRIDFYIINNNIYFGEITFYPANGFGLFTPKNWNYKLGELIDLHN